MWTVRLDDGGYASARFLVSAVGALSVPTMPAIEGLDRFAGEMSHTAALAARAG